VVTQNLASSFWLGVDLLGIVELNLSASTIFPSKAFDHATTYRNAFNVAANHGPYRGFDDAPLVQVNRNSPGVVTCSLYQSYRSAPTFGQASTDGTLTVTTVNQAAFAGVAGTGAAVTTWNRIDCGPLTGGGSVTTLRHVVLRNETVPAVVEGIRSEMVAGTFLQHVGTAPCNFGGSVNFGAGATVDVTLSRGAANRLDLAAGDTLRLHAGILEFGAAGDVALTRGSSSRLDLSAGDTFRIPSGALEIDDVSLSRGAANRLDLAMGDTLRISSTGALEIDDVSLSRGAANRLDIATGDSIRLSTTGQLQWSTTENISGGSGTLSLAANTLIELNQNVACSEDLQVPGFLVVGTNATEFLTAASGVLTHTAATRHAFNTPVTLPSYTVAGVPSASPAAQMIYVSNETGGAVPAFSDGTNWRRVTDRAIVS
jgi:hypothetical protein